MLTLRNRHRYRPAPRWLLAALLLALVLNGVAYLTHRHSSDEYRGSISQTELCGLCTTFGALGAAPAVAATGPVALLLVGLVPVWLLAAPVLRRFATAARPRAPPLP